MLSPEEKQKASNDLAAIPVYELLDIASAYGGFFKMTFSKHDQEIAGIVLAITGNKIDEIMAALSALELKWKKEDKGFVRNRKEFLS